MELYENYDDDDEDQGRIEFKYQDDDYEDNQDLIPIDNLDKEMIGSFNFERNLIQQMGGRLHHDIVSVKK
jgi:hypothetical protein